MSLTKDDQRLLDETDNSVKLEREATIRVLKNFLEIDRRRLYSALGKGSLKEFVMDRYRLSEDEAWRRIKAMKLLKEIPAIEEKIEAGKLSMTHIGLAQSLFSHEARKHEHVYSVEEKIQVLEKLENTTTREAQKLTFSLASSPMFKSIDRIRQVSESEVEFKFRGPQELEAKLEKIKGLLAHRSPGLTMAGLINRLCELGFDKWDPARQNPKAKSHAVNPAAPRSGHSKIPAHLKRAIWKRDQAQCSICRSTFALQIDHIKPVALGGEDTADNLRILCRACNQRAAIQVFGVGKMGRYLKWENGHSSGNGEFGMATS